MDELTFDNEKYVSSKRAAQMTGYAKDYVGQLCREGRVKARLVGRNWYVLESSILEHRFGAEETVQEEISTTESPASAWDVPTYIPEVPVVLPSLATKPEINPEPLPAQISATEPLPERADTLADMQSAWKEWFERQEKALPDASDMLLADYEEPHQDLAAETPILEEAEEQVSLRRSKEEDEEITVPIARVRAQHTRLRSFRDEEPMDLRAPQRQYDAGPARMQEGRYSRTKAAPSPGYALRAFFVAVALIAVSVAFIGSGVLDQALQASHSASFLTDFIAGRQQIAR